MTDKTDPAITNVLAALAVELGITANRQPWSMDRIAALIDMPARRDLVTELLFGILPATIDAGQWIAWIQGDQPPVPASLQNPEHSARPSARGAVRAATTKHQSAMDKVARLEAQLLQAKQEQVVAEADRQRSADQLRAVVVYRIMVEIGRQASGIALGPLYALARAVSPYLQQDLAFENALDDQGRILLNERRQTREQDSREMLDRLDRYAGEQALELKLHRAMLKVIRAFHDEREAENAAVREAGERLPTVRKRQAVRRTSEAQQRDVHPAAPRADVIDVFDAFASLRADASNDNDEPA